MRCTDQEVVDYNIGYSCASQSLRSIFPTSTFFVVLCIQSQKMCAKKIMLLDY